MDKEKEQISLWVHEETAAMMERTIRRLWITTLLLIVLLVATNGAWLWYESQFEYFTTTVTQENEDGYNNYIGNDGEIVNGTTNGDSNRKKKENWW